MQHLTLTRALTVLLLTPLAACGSGSGEDTGAGATGTTSATMTLSDPGPTDPTTTDGPTTGEPTGSTTTTTTATTTGDPGTTTIEPTTDATTTTTTTDATTTTTTTDTGDTTTGNGLWDSPNLWYAVDKALIYIEVDPMDGSIIKLVHNELVADTELWHGQNGLTMLEDGTLLGSRESKDGTQIYHIPNPSTLENTPATAVFLGIVPGQQGEAPPRVEALYTDCDGRIYLMDTGEDVGSATGNRLLRFKGAYLKGELEFDVITDLGDASVADIDDMSPAIIDGEISDGVGFAMDSTDLWQIDYTTGTGMKLADTDGTWGIHALGGPLFTDGEARLYILSSDAELLRVQLDDYSSTALITGPDLELDSGYNGWSGLAGPLTECMTTIPG
jgi:hypothetical protein